MKNNVIAFISREESNIYDQTDQRKRNGEEAKRK